MDSEARLLLITTDLQLRDDVALIAATAGAALDVRSSWRGIDAQDWTVLMCGQDSPPTHHRRTRRTLLLGRTDGDPAQEQQLWRLAAGQSGLQPVPLPAAETWLAQELGEAVLDRSPGRVVAVLGALGGAGASTVSYLAAAELAVRGASVVLLDADPAPGAGIAALGTGPGNGVGNGVDGAAAVGWEELGALDGEISAAQLGAALPVTEGIHLVTGAPGRDVRRRMLEPVACSARRAFDWVIVDAAREPETVQTLRHHLDQLLVVAPCSARGAKAARQVKHLCAELPLGLVANGLSQIGWSPPEVSDAAEVPLAGDIPEQRWLRRESELSGAYELLRSRRGAAIIGALLETLDVASPVSRA
ncbi:hypothetical protein [Nesterenkonia lutea]|uniref:Mrp family chromosome partitioning ATPase n=1 Tax=Nesterenkonia lutea TaxID=272919 RepID=A0ABR9JHN6_9MICC|nr:hypothetical protein [Nesterenkonia lutea]MBE1525436.1 Mrp family chromosome partitioning ATPase [Nesterenkonia lutea]